MSHPFNDKVEESVYEKGKTDGYEECMKEWLGFLRSKLSNSSDSKVISDLIQERWHVEGDGVAHGK